jgi:hypothetical protein
VKIERRRKISYSVAVAVITALSLTVVGLSRVANGKGSVQSGSKFCASSTIRDSNGPKVRLGLSQRTVQPGGVIKSRLENGGMRDLGYGREQTLQRFQNGRWVKLPQENPVFQSLSVVHAGMAGRCQSVHIPATAQHGRYRVRQKVVPLASPKPKRIFLIAYFRVLDRT